MVSCKKLKEHHLLFIFFLLLISISCNKKKTPYPPSGTPLPERVPVATCSPTSATPLEITPAETSWTSPQIECSELWKAKHDIENPFQYDYSKDPIALYSSSSCLMGNYGYIEYQNRVTNSLAQKWGGDKNDYDRKRCEKELTLLVYMSADNDLTPYALWDLFEMESSFKGFRGGSQLYSDIIVELDAKGSAGIRRYHIFQTPNSSKSGVENREFLGFENFKNKNTDLIQSPIVMELKEDATKSHSSRLYDFLQWGIQNYPSKHYMVVLWGHGHGWVSENKNTNPNKMFVEMIKDNSGRLLNDDKGDVLTIPDLNKILLKIQNELIKKPIDIYASDACLMQSVEVAYELSHSTEFVIGSAQIQSYLGYPYRSFIKKFNDILRFRKEGSYLPYKKIKKSFVSASKKRVPAREQTCGNHFPCQLTYEFIELVKLSWAPLGNQGRYDSKSMDRFTVSAISSQELKNRLSPLLNNLGELLFNYIKYLNLEEKKHMIELIKMSPHFFGDNRDLLNFLSRLENDLASKYRAAPLEQDEKNVLLNLLLLTQETSSSLKKTIINYRYGDSYVVKYGPGFFGGLSGWLPSSQSIYSEHYEEISSSTFYRTLPNWSKWFGFLNQEASSIVRAGH